MSRRLFWLGLVALGVLLSVSLSAALGVAPPAALLTPTVGPLDHPAFLPLVLNAEAGPTTVLPSATATLAATSTSVPATATAEATATPPTDGLVLNLTERLQWYEPQTTGGSYDLVIVHDFSWSMRLCWTTNQVCPTGSRRIDKSAEVMRSFVNEMLRVRNLEKGGDNRLALVTYGQIATQQIPFNNDTNAALAAFETFFGTDANPRNFVNDVDIKGNTNTTDGLVKGVNYLNDARTVDKYGRPVRLAVLVLTDGLANVFNDGGMQYKTNRWDLTPFFCGETSADLDNPWVQATCPSDAEFPNINPKPLPPLKAMVKAADDARNARPTQFYAVVVGEQFGLTPVTMHLSQVAPDHYYMPYSPAQLDGIVNAIAVQLGEPCSEYASGLRPAAGASVTMSEQSGEVVGTYTADAQGRVVVPDLPAGEYTLTAAHLDVVAPADPQQIMRDYTRMIVDGASVPVTRLAFTMPDGLHVLPAIKLVLDDPLNAQCPS